MESLESKLDRLSHEQRREVEDFVDFLISRSCPKCFPLTASDSPNMASFTFTPFEAVHAEETGAVRPPDPARGEEREAPGGRDEPAPAPFLEIGGMPDRITRDYMDYGQFEQRQSPATEAVKKVRRTITARDEQQKPRHLLDWVD
ncbi:MAG TPA: hypothetical protein VLL74_02540 [Methanoregula sp.]|nr:hypothetical protein [Methanoregula sp.]